MFYYYYHHYYYILKNKKKFLYGEFCQTLEIMIHSFPFFIYPFFPYEKIQKKKKAKEVSCFATHFSYNEFKRQGVIFNLKIQIYFLNPKLK